MTIESSYQLTERPLPDGVKIIPLKSNQDSRGNFTEIFREEWLPQFPARQWNVVHSEAGVLRGVHVHIRHSDYLFLAKERCVFGLFDCRRGSPTEYMAAQVEANEENPFALIIPPGVAHGFYFYDRSIHIYAVTHYWDHTDELGCRYDDPELGIGWPSKEVKLSPRDRELGSLRELLSQMHQ